MLPNREPAPAGSEPRSVSTPAPRVLMVEDDQRLLDVVQRGLTEQGFRVLTAADGHAGLALARRHIFDVLVLDIGLPGMDGYDIAARLRKEQNQAAILMLTARDMEEDVIRGFDMGADEYLRKPFSFRELVARIHIVARRAAASASPWLRFAGLELDCHLRRCFCAGQPIHLSPSEVALLEALLREAGHPVAREELAAHLWGGNAHVTQGALDTLVAALRTRLDVPGGKTVIRTLRGLGYALERRDAPETRLP